VGELFACHGVIAKSWPRREVEDKGRCGTHRKSTKFSCDSIVGAGVGLFLFEEGESQGKVLGGLDDLRCCSCCSRLCGHVGQRTSWKGRKDEKISEGEG
jgi:hypothetical protein